MKNVRRAIYLCIFLLSLTLLLTSCRGMLGSIGNELIGGGESPGGRECEHEWEILQETPPTCSGNGQIEKRCRLCSDKVFEPIDPMGHVLVEVAEVPATCTERGIAAGTKCSVCGEIFSGFESIEPREHNYVILEYVAPTCTEDGLSEGRYCDLCDTVLDEQEVIEASGHRIHYDGGCPATCTEKGFTSSEYCLDCEEMLVEAEVLPATGHVNLNVIKGEPATCFSEGLSDGYVCNDCGLTVTEQTVLPVAGHKLVRQDALAASCKTDGYTGALSCEECGTVLQKSMPIEKTGHRFENGSCSCGLIASVGLSFALNDTGDGYVLVGIGSFSGDELVIPDTYLDKPIVAIAGGALEGETGLIRVIVTGDVRSIGENAFAGCTSLEYVEIPVTLVTVEKNAFDGCEALVEISCADSEQTETWEEDCFGSSAPIIRAEEKGGMTPYEIFLYAMAHVHNNENRYKLRQDFVISSTLNGQPFSNTSYYTLTEAAGLYEIHQYNSQTGESVWMVDNVCYYRSPENSYKWSVGREYVREQNLKAAGSSPTYTEEFFKDAEFIKNPDGSYTLVLVMNEENMSLMMEDLLGDKGIPGSYFEKCVYTYNFDANGHITDIQADAVYWLPATAQDYVVATYDISTVFSDVGTLEAVSRPTGSFTDITRTNCYCTESMQVIVPGVLPTCIEDGTSDGIYCKNCFADKQVSQVLRAFGHKFVNGVCTLCGDFENASSGLHYEFNSDGLTCTVAGIGECTDTEIVIPETIYGVRVIGIERAAFKGCSQITSIAIPASVSTVGDGAFNGCTSLRRVETPLALLESIPSNVEEIILIDGEVIGRDDFARFTDLTMISLPETLMGIEDGAFRACERILVIVNESILPITAGESSFGGVARNALEVVSSGKDRRSYIFGDFLFTLEEGTSTRVYALVRYLGNDTRVVVPVPSDGAVERIRDGAFDGCSFIEEIVFPKEYADGNVSFDGTAFSGLRGLKKATGSSWYLFHFSLISKELHTLVFNGSEIDAYDFKDNKTITHVTVTDSVTWIGESAFENCSSLSELILPPTMEGINVNAFAGTAITEVTVPAGITSLNAFMNCKKLSRVTLPEGLLKLGGFNGCTSLYTLELPESLEEIYSYAFEGSGLKFLVIPDRVTWVGADALSSCRMYSLTLGTNLSHLETCYDLRVAEVINHSEFISDASEYFSGTLVVHSGEESKLFCKDGYYFFEADGVTYLVGYLGESTDLDLPPLEDGRTYEIAKYAFYDRDDITSIRIDGDFVTAIGRDAFYDCGSVREIYYNASAVTKAPYAFNRCGIPTNVAPDMVGTVLTVGKDVKTIPSNMFVSAYVSDLRFEEGSACTQIEDGAFMTSSLERIEFPPSLLSVGSQAFNCGRLREIQYNCVYDCSISPQVFDISYQYSKPSVSLTVGRDVSFFPSALFGVIHATNVTFEGTAIEKVGYLHAQPYLESIVLPVGVTSVEEGAFSECTALVSVTLPDTLKVIGDGAFEGCTALSEILLPTTGLQIGADAFLDTVPDVNAKSSVLYIGNHLIKAYAPGNYYTVPTGTASIAAYAFSDTSVASVTLPEGLTHIGAYAFNNCRQLTSLSLPDSLEWVGDTILYNCSPAFTTENNVKYLGNAENPYVLLFDVTVNTQTSYVVPAGVRVIYDRAFEDCSSMTEMVLPEGVRQISARAFEDCSAMGSIKLPTTLRYIGEQAFHYCRALTEIEILEGVTEIAYGTFSNCVVLSVVKLPSSLRSVGEMAFYRCEALESLTLPAGVTYVGETPFFEAGIKTVTLPASLKKIEKNWTAYADALQTVYFEGTPAAWTILSRFMELEEVTWTVEFI